VYFADNIELYDGIVKELDERAPFSFIAYFDQSEVLNNADWVYIRLFLKSFLYDGRMPRLTRRMTNLLGGQHSEIAVYSDPVKIQQENHEPCYSFKKAVFEDRNIALCEIIKPIIVKCMDKLDEKILTESSVPYTVVIRNFATRGYYPVFWSLFVCDSWGKDNKDIQFLKALWKDLEMSQEFDMDLILENGMKECNWGNGEGACSGPEVYRKNLGETLDVLISKERGYAK
jgi:hypothetical protein